MSGSSSFARMMILSSLFNNLTNQDSCYLPETSISDHSRGSTLTNKQREKRRQKNAARKQSRKINRKK